MSRIVFIDLEASGLGPTSWPIEVAWCFLQGGVEAHFIKPEKDWPAEAWDPAAEDLHGISRKELERKGSAAPDVCNRINETLRGRAVYSDAPDWDGFWLYRLFSAAKIRQQFALHDFAELFAAASPEAFAAAKASADQTAPHRHRAKEDVLHMRALFELAGAARDD